jgi:uncharacterized membrane protein
MMMSSTKKYRYLALVCHLCLLAWIAVWQYFLRPEPVYSSVFIFCMYVLPLLFPLPGIMKGKPYTHAWANFIVLFYVIHGLTIIYAEPHEWMYAIIELLLATGMFIGCAVYARKRGRELGQGLKKLKTVMEEERQRFEG